MEYQVTIEGTGHRFPVRDDETVLAGALRAGLIIPYSCRGGTCGSCMGKVVEGQVVYPGDVNPPALDPRAAAVGQALFCQAQPVSDLAIEVREVRSGGDIEPRRMPCRVVAMHRLSRDVMQLDLKIPEHERLAFVPGQYIDILMRDGRRRSYSLANPPHRDAVLELQVRHLPGGAFSDHVFSGMQEKALLRLEGPFGLFHLREDSTRPVLMMAGGTGLAPMESMLEHAFAQGLDRPIHLFWGVRAAQDLYHDERLSNWQEQYPDFRYTPVLSEPEASDLTHGRWLTGWVHEQLLAAYPDLRGYDLYMSGPPAMINAAQQAFAAHGLQPDHVWFDAFEHAADAGSGDAAD